MQTQQTSLVITGANTIGGCKVFWNGVEVPTSAVRVVNDADEARVVLEVPEQPLIAELQAAGVVVRRAAP